VIILILVAYCFCGRRSKEPAQPAPTPAATGAYGNMTPPHSYSGAATGKQQFQYMKVGEGYSSGMGGNTAPYGNGNTGSYAGASPYGPSGAVTGSQGGAGGTGGWPSGAGGTSGWPSGAGGTSGWPRGDGGASASATSTATDASTAPGTAGSSVMARKNMPTLGGVYAAAYPTINTVTGNTTYMTNGPPTPPGPNASASTKQEYLQYQLDSLGHSEVLDGLVLQEGMHTRLLGGTVLPCHACGAPLPLMHTRLLSSTVLPCHA
jgi:hypothetical protein